MKTKQKQSKQISDAYQIAESDCTAGWQRWGMQFGTPEEEATFRALSDEQYEAAEIFVEAGYIHAKTGRWPTAGQVRDKWQQDAEREARDKQERETRFAKFAALWKAGHDGLQSA